MAACLTIVLFTAFSILPDYFHQQGTTPPDNPNGVVADNSNNTTNDNHKNLKWGTQKQNMEDARKNGKLRGSSCKASRAKLSKKDLILIFKLKAKGLYYKDIAKRLGVSVGTIGRVINKKSYRDENIDRKR